MELQKNRNSKFNGKKPAIEEVWVHVLSGASMPRGGKKYEIYERGIVLREGVAFSDKEIAMIAQDFISGSRAYGQILTKKLVAEKIMAVVSADCLQTASCG